VDEADVIDFFMYHADHITTYLRLFFFFFSIQYSICQLALIQFDMQPRTIRIGIACDTLEFWIVNM
jgi:hypothetical protein